MNNVFSIVPWDVKQYAIGEFLCVADRTAWNQALKKDERVFKKLDKSYAHRHQILVLSRKFNSMNKRLASAEKDIDESGFLIDYGAIQRAETALLDICRFCKSRDFEFLVKYSSLVGRVIKSGLEFYSNPDSPTPLYEVVPQSQSHDLAGCAAIALTYTGFINLVSDTAGVTEHGRMLRDAEN